ncbi:hypothetical protein WJX72_007335 [[Myrmecia] bisecta]|uniref:EF-hand domain-containing protein n=1 Tax=[Myrmecia] bisecta TaxID=41462 RepID=A0AAW1P0R0_9CHLO
MLSLVASLLHVDTEEAKNLTEKNFDDRVLEVFSEADVDKDGLLEKTELFNYLVDNQVDVSHITVEKLYRQISEESGVITQSQFLKGLKKYTRLLGGTGDLKIEDLANAAENLNVGPAPNGRHSVRSTDSPHGQHPRPQPPSSDTPPMSPSGSSSARSRTSMDNGSRPLMGEVRGRRTGEFSGRASPFPSSPASGPRSQFSSARRSDPMRNSDPLPMRKTADPMRSSDPSLYMSDLSKVMQAEKQREKDLMRRRALHKSLAGLKDIFHDIDSDCNGRMSYEEFYTFLERTNPDMCPSASSIFHTLDKRLDGEVRFKDILRVLYPHSSEKELQEMLRLVTRKKKVKDASNIEQQIQELKDIFAIYDDDGSGELDKPEFIDALVSAGYEREEATDMFDIIDADHGGTVSMEEFIEWFMHNKTGNDRKYRPSKDRSNEEVDITYD